MWGACKKYKERVNQIISIILITVKNRTTSFLHKTLLLRLENEYAVINGKVSVWRHHFFIRYEIIQYLIYLNEISLFVKMSEKVVAPYGK